MSLEGIYGESKNDLDIFEDDFKTILKICVLQQYASFDILKFLHISFDKVRKFNKKIYNSNFYEVSIHLQIKFCGNYYANIIYELWKNWG